MGRRNGNGLAWTTRDESLIAVTKIGHHRIARPGGHAIGVGAYFRRGCQEHELGRFGTIERARPLRAALQRDAAHPEASSGLRRSLKL